MAGGLIVPECYCVDECYMDRERAKPNSTDLYPVSPQEFGHHLWSNSVYIILLLISMLCNLLAATFRMDLFFLRRWSNSQGRS